METSIGQTNPFETGPLASARAQSTSTTSTPTSSTAGSATVTANDFLELLVSEMKNQDPTANTDPNEYISQLVQVNSLEQLVQINQDLGSSASTGTDSSASGSSADASAAAAGAAGQAPADQATGISSGQGGNLALPGSNAAAARVADSLQFPSVTTSAMNLQNLIRTPGSNLNTGRINPGTAH